MTPLRKRRWATAVIAAVVAFSWLGASDHCALATIERAAVPAHACCHDGDQDKAPPKPTQCCEAFNVPLPELTVAPAGHFFVLQPAWIEALSVLSVSRAVGCEARANAPPGARTFTEIVLNRSLLAHAPPLFVA